MFIMAGRVVATYTTFVISATLYYMLGFKDAITTILIARSVNDGPFGLRCLILGMETQRPVFVVFINIRTMESDMVFCTWV